MALSSPIHEMPLSDEDLLIVARITLMWSHIDGFVDVLLMMTGRLSPGMFDHFFGSKTITPKLEAVRLYAAERPDLPQAAIAEMCKLVTDCNRDRNLMTHGTWGWRLEGDVYTACAWSRTKKSYFDVERLEDLHERVYRASVSADVVFHAVTGLGEPPPARNRRILIGDGPPPEPEPPAPAKFVR